jgi:hypothetical protein
VNGSARLRYNRTLITAATKKEYEAFGSDERKGVRTKDSQMGLLSTLLSIFAEVARPVIL